MPDIYDNLELSLGDQLTTTFDSYDQMKVATGYFDLRGWRSVMDIVSSKVAALDETEMDCQEPIVKVMVGMVAHSDAEQILESLQHQVQPSASGEDHELIDNETAKNRRAQLVKHLRTQLMRGLPTKQDQQTLQTLKFQLESGAVRIKVFTRRPLHGKTYIFHQKHPVNPIIGYVGSSNFTGAGMYNNLELNVDVTDKDAVWKVDSWFEQLWSERTTLDITADILTLLEESWASDNQRTPYEVFLKVCHSLSKDVREGNASYSLPLVMRNLLLDYQASAVKTLARRLVTRGGTMLGDVVGLGKTYTAIATALMLQTSENYTTLVLCPKNLEQMWQEYLEAYDILGKVVPYSMATKILPDLRRHMLVICDESHTLRKDTRKDYEAIKEYIRQNSSKVMLLTATPYNLDFQDVAAQLALYLDDDDDLGITPTAALREDPTLAEKVDGKTSTLQAFRRSENADDWKRLMSDHLVRRTRSFIKNNYSKTETILLPDGTVEEREYLTFPNGEKFIFPKRIARPVNHEFSENDPAVIMESDNTIDGIKALRLPRYNAPQYINPQKLTTQEDKDFAERAARGRGHVAGFVRTGLYKRLSSCGYSFIQSLDRQLARNELCLFAIDNGLPIPLGSLDTKLLAPEADYDVESPLGSAGSVESRYALLQREKPADITWVSPKSSDQPSTSMFFRTTRSLPI